MILASHQTDFFPYMGYFYKVFRSDAFVFSDNVQFSKTGRHNYNLILADGKPRKLTLPVHYHVQNLNELKIAADKVTVEKMLKTIFFNYRKAAYFDRVFPIMEDLLRFALDAPNLAVFNERCIVSLCGQFGLIKGRRFYLSSELDLKERKDARIIEMCEALGADTYLSGTGAKDYHIEEDYRTNGIQLIYSDYEPVVYQQVGREFVENMSVIDYVMNCGFRLPGGWKK